MKNVYLLLVFLFAACSEEHVSRQELVQVAMKAESDIHLVMPDKIDVPVVDCHQYDPPCFTGHKVKIKGLELVALEYQENKQAFMVAKEINGLVYMNWVFDQVIGEPILERFVKNNFNAVKARDYQELPTYRPLGAK